MKKSLVLLAGASLAFLGMPAVTHAQAASGPFADVPTDHWAYQSVDTLQKAGIVIGYPDGTYGGRRPMTRYEFAVAIARLLAQMKPGVTSGDLTSLRTDLENRIAGNTQAIDALRQLVNGFQPELTRLGQDVTAINARLDALEAKVNALGNRLDRDEGILGSVVDEQRRVKITGEVNLIAEGRSSRRKGISGYNSFLDQNGTPQGSSVGLGSGGNVAGVPIIGGSRITRDALLSTSDVYHDVLLHIRGRLSDTATANVDLDFGNYLSNVGNTAAFGGSTSLLGSNGSGLSSLTNGGFVPFGGLSPGSSTAASQYSNVYQAYLDAAVKLGPLGGAELLVGRKGLQYTKYTLMQADADIYTNLTQTDSGDITADGIGANLKLGPAKVSTFAAKFKAIPFSQAYGGSAIGSSAQFRPGGLIAANHAMPIDDGIGARVTFGAPEGAVLGATVETFGLDNLSGGTTANGNPLGLFDGRTDPNHVRANGTQTGNAQFNRLSVYGVDFNGALPFGLPGVKKGGVLIDAAYTVSAHGINNDFNNVGNDFRYQSTDDQVGIALGGLHLKGGYKYIGPQFSAPGYWGKLGAWTNPTNVRGPVVSAKYAFTPKLSLNADAQFYKAAYGRNAAGSTINSPLHQNDHVSRYQVGLGYGLSSTYGVDLGYEDVQYDLRNEIVNGVAPLITSGRPEETYVNIGLGHSFSSNASLKLLYQIVHYDDKGTGFDSLDSPTRGKSDGSVASAQFQLKF